MRALLSWLRWRRLYSHRDPWHHFVATVDQDGTLRTFIDGRGVRLRGGSDKPSASTTERERGTLTPATATSEVCSFYSPRGDQLAASYVQTLLPRENSFTVPGTFTFVTGGRGVSGVPPERAA